MVISQQKKKIKIKSKSKSKSKSNSLAVIFLINLLFICYKFLPISLKLKESIKHFIFEKFPNLTTEKSKIISLGFISSINYNYKNFLQVFLRPLNLNLFLYKLPPFLIYKAKSIKLKTSTKPLVSIIIPIFGQIGFTIRCLKSISLNLPKCTFEIIVIDDASQDNSLDILKFIKDIKVFKNATNRGFIYSCNFGAKKAKGDYLYFLNNDTQVTEGWLDYLVQTFNDFPGTGLVGSKLVFPNGKLQEAGGIIWKDGSAWNFGRGQDPNLPIFNYAREVDYCSGASIMIPKAIFTKMKGFDPLYSPAYCEDSDLALKLRSQGYRVIYQPLSTVIHFEGMTSGVDTSSGIKSYQITNLKKQYNRWKHKLNKHERNGEYIDWAINRRADKKALVIDEITPEPDKDAGSLLTFNMMLLLREMNFQVTFIARNLQYSEKYTSLLQRFGIEVIYLPYLNSVQSHLKELGERYGLIFIFRPNLADEMLNYCRRYTSKAKIIYHTVDLHFLRMFRDANLVHDKEKEIEASKMKKIEINLIKNADASIVVSKAELKILKQENAQKKVYLLSLIKATSFTDKLFKNRSGIVYVGGFNHQPNVDAVKFFVGDIMPILRKKDKAIVLYIIGSHPPREILAMQSTTVKVVGFVEKLDPILNNMRVMIAPLRYGAGVKGKIVSAMSLGLPVVATSLGAEGMGLTHKKNILIANDPNSFAQNVLDLYRNVKLWNHISENSLNFAKRNWGPEIAYKNLSKIISKLKISIPKPQYTLSLYDENG